MGTTIGGRKNKTINIIIINMNIVLLNKNDTNKTDRRKEERNMALTCYILIGKVIGVENSTASLGYSG